MVDFSFDYLSNTKYDLFLINFIFGKLIVFC